MKSKTVPAGMENTEREMSESEQPQHKIANAPSIEEIRQRAHEMHIEGGCVHGRDQDDWFQAERELLETYRASTLCKNDMQSGEQTEGALLEPV